MALVVATQRLLAAALREPRNQRFAVLSESCASVSGRDPRVRDRTSSK